MEKYADQSGVGDRAEVVAGPKKGLTGVVKEASAGKIKIVSDKGVEHTVDETAVELKGK